jgi:hypothetical protein
MYISIEAVSAKVILTYLSGATTAAAASPPMGPAATAADDYCPSRSLSLLIHKASLQRSWEQLMLTNYDGSRVTNLAHA